MTPLVNKLGEQVTLQGVTLWGKRGTSLRFDDNSAGDTVDKLCLGLMNSAGDRKNFAEDGLSVENG